MLMPSIQSYLALRRMAGFDLRLSEGLLRNFAGFVSNLGETHIRTATAISWAAQAPSATQRARRLAVVRLLARHLHSEDPRHEVPRMGFSESPCNRADSPSFSKPET